MDDERAQPTFKEFRASLARLNDANTPLSISDRVMILSNATFLLDEYRAASPQPLAQTERAMTDDLAAWFSLADGAAAEIEQAAISITDPDAKRVATNAADYVRRRCKALLAQLEATERDDSSEAK